MHLKTQRSAGEFPLWVLFGLQPWFNYLRRCRLICGRTMPNIGCRENSSPRLLNFIQGNGFNSGSSALYDRSEPIELVKRALVAKESLFDANLLAGRSISSCPRQLDVGETFASQLAIRQARRL